MSLEKYLECICIYFMDSYLFPRAQVRVPGFGLAGARQRPTTESIENSVGVKEWLRLVSGLWTMESVSESHGPCESSEL